VRATPSSALTASNPSLRPTVSPSASSCSTAR
jgi:hypothetical protein